MQPIQSKILTIQLNSEPKFSSTLICKQLHIVYNPKFQMTIHNNARIEINYKLKLKNLEVAKDQPV